jgi:hypothetical protein
MAPKRDELAADYVKRSDRSTIGTRLNIYNIVD